MLLRLTLHSRGGAVTVEDSKAGNPRDELGSKPNTAGQGKLPNASH